MAPAGLPGMHNRSVLLPLGFETRHGQKSPERAITGMKRCRVVAIRLGKRADNHRHPSPCFWL